MGEIYNYKSLKTELENKGYGSKRTPTRKPYCISMEEEGEKNDGAT